MSEGTMKNKDNQQLVLTEGMMHKYARLNLLQTGMAAAVLFMAADSGLYAAEDAGAAAQKSPAVKEASPEVSPEEVARSRSETIGREIVTREADESLADSYALDAAKAYEAGNYDESVTAYLKAIEILTKLGDLPRFQEKIESCKVAISKAYYYWSLRIYYEAQDSAKAGNYDLAIENCRKAMELYPPCKSRMEEAIANAEKTAQQFANNSHSTLNKIVSADQGQFSIDNRDLHTPWIKKVRVVTTITYSLKD